MKGFARSPLMVLTLSLLPTASSSAWAQSDREAGLFAEAQQLPMRAQSVAIEVRGGEATVAILQTFENPGQRVAQADFRMPMPEGASLDGFGYWRGERYLESSLREKGEAQVRHRGAAEKGRASGLAKSSAGAVSFSVYPVEAGGSQRVLVRLRLPVVNELGRSHISLPVASLLGGAPVKTMVDARLEAESGVKEWGFEGGAPVMLQRGERTLHLAAQVATVGHLWWREKRDPLEVRADAVPLAEGDHGLVIKAFLSSQGYEDLVRRTVVFVDASFSMRRKLVQVERALRRLGPSTEIHGVASGHEVFTAPGELLKSIEGGALGHSLDPFLLRAGLRAQGCEGGGRCLVLSDGPGVSEGMGGTEVRALVLAEAEEAAHYVDRLPGGTEVHRVDGDSGSKLDARVDRMVRPILRVISVRSLAGHPVELLDPVRDVAAGGVLRVSARVAQISPLEVWLEAAGGERLLTVPAEPAAPLAGPIVRRSVYRSELARMMRRYRRALKDEATPRVDLEALRAEIVALSLREDIPTALTARQVDDPELSLAAIKGGDPHLTIADRPDRTAAYAIYPFGELRSMVRDEARGEWVDRFLAPRHWSERAYAVGLFETFDDGTTSSRETFYLLDDRAPNAQLAWIDDNLVVDTRKSTWEVSMVRVLAPRMPPVVLAAVGNKWKTPTDDLPARFEVEIRDRAGNRSAFAVRIQGGELEVEGEGYGAEDRPRQLPVEKVRLQARGAGPYSASLDGNTMFVQLPTGRVRFAVDDLGLQSLDVLSFLELEVGSEDTGRKYLVGLRDGHLLALTCRQGDCRAEAVEGTFSAHPVRGLVRYRDQILVAILGQGLFRLVGERLVRTDYELPTRFVSALAVLGSRVYVGTLYDGLWRLVGPRAIKTRFPVSHVDGLELIHGRLWIRSVGGRYLRRGTDRFVRRGAPSLEVGQDDLTSVVAHCGRVYAGGFDSGLFEVSDDGRLVSVPLSKRGSIRARHVNALASFDGSLWVGTEAGLIEVRDQTRRWVLKSAVHGLASGQSGLAVASSGGVYVVPNAGGAADRRDVANTGARSAFSTVGWFEGSLYAGSIDGLYRIDGDRMQPLGGLEGYRGGWVTALLGTEEGLFIGSYADGVWRLPGRDRAVHAVTGLEDMWVPFRGLAGFDGGLWVGGLGMSPRWRRSEDGQVYRWAVPARDVNDVVLLGNGRALLATDEGPVWLKRAPARVAVDARRLR